MGEFRRNFVSLWRRLGGRAKVIEDQREWGEGTANSMAGKSCGRSEVGREMASPERTWTGEASIGETPMTDEEDGGAGRGEIL